MWNTIFGPLHGCMCIPKRLLSFTSVRNFAVSSHQLAPKGPVRKRPRGEYDVRVRMIRYYMKHPITPRPLRFSRHRALRHWTIHRAAQLLLHKSRRERERFLEQQYNAMRWACEELRLGLGDGGRLYRQAISRKGIYGGWNHEQRGSVVGNGGIPLEYARAQTESPPSRGFNEDWKRP